MKDTKKYEECRQLQLQFEDYLYERRVEPGNNTEVQSISSMSEKGKDDNSEDEKRLLEKILDPHNLNTALRKVKANRGSHGVDGMVVDELLPYFNQNGDELRQSILKGVYAPKPVRRVEIPKPDGGKRLLGIPTVVDRVIQQAISQILSPIYERIFSDNSYGFRPNRNAKQAVLKGKEYLELGYTWVIDIDLAKYFDTVNHDKLMRLLSKTIKDGRVLSLVRKYLKSGVMISGVSVEMDEGCPQGGNLSPLLSNIMLNELDKELSKRGLNFCRYADDCNIYVKSRKAANRVMKSITKFIEIKLKLKVNKEKSTVDRPWKLKFLGYSFYCIKGRIGIRVHQKSVRKFKQKLKGITGRSNGKSMIQRMLKLKQLITGWVNYFSLAEMKSVTKKLDEWLRRRIRMCYWKQWKRIKTKHDNLVKLGIDNNQAWQFANTRKGYWRVAGSHILHRSLGNNVLKKWGLLSIYETYSYVC